mmetsp:Transcript_20386/g.47662  ORF Transcript_20386/g.47662 Transcript_20386/m.47662 type:complete len:197 (-) Transcript_20386:200-790(-)
MSADDGLDDLLNDLEEALVAPSSTARAPAASKPAEAPPQRETKTKEDESLDDLLEDLLDEDIPVVKCAVPRPAQVDAAAAGAVAQCKGTKCSPVFLAGADTECGQGSHAQRRACDHLRCTKCDFAVLRFLNVTWKPEVDYLFFRNNMPDKAKLATSLGRKSGTASYCCQCSWRSADQGKVSTVAEDTELRWVCGGH